MLLSLCLGSFVFTGFYISYDLSYEGEIGAYDYSYSEDADSGSLGIGYESAPQNNMLYGGSFDIIGAEYGSSSWEIFNTYGKYLFAISPTMTGWGSIGYNIPLGDLDEFDGGISYGLGLNMNNGIGVGLLFNNLTNDDYGYDIDLTIQRLQLTYNF
tara:strand:+ start:340 stop:807 length:468 start_codon:yes stop_codon:yes gene_type:complete